MSEKYCAGCGETHTGKTGKACKGVRREPDDPKDRPKKGSIMADEAVEESEMDADELQLRADVKTEQAKTRKIALRRQLARLKVKNDKAEQDPLEESDEEGEAPGTGGGHGSGGGGSGEGSGDGPLGPWRDLERHSPTTERRRRSKYDLLGYLENNDPKTLQFPDFIYASMKWGCDQEEATAKELRGFMAHVGYLAMKTAPGVFMPKAMAGYDSDIRLMADKYGMAAFTGGLEHVSIRHYGYENTWAADRARRAAAEAGRGGVGRGRGGGRGRGLPSRQQQQQPSRRGGPCYDWNLEKGGCTDNQCEKYHTCMYCWDPNHKGTECKDRSTLNPASSRGGRR